jgi:hypothetical protein
VDKFVDKMCIYCVNRHFCTQEKSLLFVFLLVSITPQRNDLKVHGSTGAPGADAHVFGHCASKAGLPLEDPNEDWLRLAGQTDPALAAIYSP